MSTFDFGLLLGRARAGDRNARGVLLEAYRPYLELFTRIRLRGRLQPKTDASDIVQQTFLEAHRDLPTFRGTTAAEFDAWLRRVLARNIANQLRHFYGTRQRDPRLETRIPEEIDASAQWPAGRPLCATSTPSRHAARREDAARLADALQLLPDDYRTVLVLRYIDGMTFPQIAARMNRSTDSVEKLWVRALARLRQTMGAAT